MLPEDRAVRIGIIGAGQIGQVHMKNYRALDGVDIVACADVNEGVARKAAETYRVPRVYTTFRELLEQKDIDAVDVCLHNHLHAPATIAALDAGKHVYCEKPMAGSYRDAFAMSEAARRRGLLLHIQIATLYSDETRAAKELVDQGELGELYHARSTGLRRRGRPYVDGYGTPSFVRQQTAGGGALYDMGTYHIAQILFLLGNPRVERISGKTYQKVDMDAKRREAAGYDVEELAVGFVRLAGGATLDIVEAWAAHLDGLDGPVLLGNKGGIRLHPFGFFRSYGHLDVSGSVNLEAARFRWNNVRGDGAHFASSQAHWLAALRGKVPLLPTADLALRTMLISDGIYLSDRLGHEVSAEDVENVSTATSLAT